jgi:hypothetical protein
VIFERCLSLKIDLHRQCLEWTPLLVAIFRESSSLKIDLKKHASIINRGGYLPGESPSLILVTECQPCGLMLAMSLL